MASGTCFLCNGERVVRATHDVADLPRPILFEGVEVAVPEGAAVVSITMTCPGCGGTGRRAGRAAGR